MSETESKWKPGITLAQVERETILAAMEFYKGNKTHASRALGIAPRTLYNRVKFYEGVVNPYQKDKLRIFLKRKT